MLVSGTLWIIFSMILFVLNFFLNSIFITQNSALIVIFGIISLTIGIWFYYLSWKNSQKK
jgi:hypothetical protein